MRTKERKKSLGEVFTPPELVNEILDSLPKDNWNEEKTFCDPAAGNGNFLVEVLKRKLSLNHDPLTALSTIYGVELMEDNTIEMRIRLYKIIKRYLNKKDKLKAIEILKKNIVCHDALNYDWSFK